MFSQERQPVQTLSRLSLATIDTIVSARLGTTLVKGNAQPATLPLPPSRSHISHPVEHA
jgi:hypothetical protein